MKKLVVVGSLLIAGAVSVALMAQSPAGAEKSTAKADKSDARKFIDQYCVGCHGQKAKELKQESALRLTLDELDIDRIAEHPEKWELVVRKVRAGMMPPSGLPRPKPEVFEKWIENLETELDRTTARRIPPPGLHRLNRNEYANVIRDLLDLKINPGQYLPSDDSTRGFDNVAAGLSISPSLLEGYVTAAGKISRMALGDISTPISATYRVPEDTSQDYHIEGMPFGTRGGILAEHEFPVDGNYKVDITPISKGNMGSNSPFGEISGEQLEVLLDGERIKLFNWDRRGGGAAPGGGATPGAAAGAPTGAGSGRAAGGGRGAGNGGRGNGGRGAGAAIAENAGANAAAGNGAAGAGRGAGAGAGKGGGGRGAGGGAGGPGGGGGDAFTVTFPVKAGRHTVVVTFLADNYAPGSDLDRHFLRDTLETGGLPGFRFFPHVGKMVIEGPFAAEDPKSAAFMKQANEAKDRARRNTTAASAAENGDEATKLEASAKVAQDEAAKLEAAAKAAQEEATAKAIALWKFPKDAPARKKLYVCTPKSASQETSCATQIVNHLARLAYRRPLMARDTELLMGFYQRGRNEGGNFDAGIEMALRRVLSDPEFVFRREAEPADVAAGKSYRISEVELASRLSFFLWSSIPDGELLRLAEQGKLRQQMDAQVKRMLADPRSSALIDNFAGQWLGIRALATQSPVAGLFPDFDDNLRNAMREEMRLFVASFIQEDRSLTEMLDANFTFVNERLAKHYGIPNVYGSFFRRVDLPASLDYRRGILGKGLFLTISSQPGRTSPVQRGKTVLQTFLGVEPPAPPPNVEVNLKSADERAGIPTMREQMELHRKNEPCASCHKIMDPIGFSLENFDAIGQWRTLDGAKPVDAAGTLVDGTKLDGPTSLRGALVRYSPQFVRVATEKMLIYALGRGTEYYDMPLVRETVKKSAKENYRFSALVRGIVESDPFQMNQKIETVGGQ